MKNLLSTLRSGMAYYMCNVPQNFFDTYEEKYFELDEKVSMVCGDKSSLEEITTIIQYWNDVMERERPPDHIDLAFVFQSILHEIKRRKNK